MKMTLETISKLPQGQEINAAIGKLVGASPEITWQIVSPETGGSANSFKRKHEAEEWLARHKTEMPNSILKDYVVAPWEYWPPYSTDLNLAAQACVERELGFSLETTDGEDAMAQLYEHRGGGNTISRGYASVFGQKRALALAVCRALLVDSISQY